MYGWVVTAALVLALISGLRELVHIIRKWKGEENSGLISMGIPSPTPSNSKPGDPPADYED